MRGLDLSKEEIKFLETYQKQKYHRFKDILVYCTILRKLTKD